MLLLDKVKLFFYKAAAFPSATGVPQAGTGLTVALFPKRKQKNAHLKAVLATGAPGDPQCKPARWYAVCWCAFKLPNHSTWIASF
jgi:hypothetical protein